MLSNPAGWLFIKKWVEQEKRTPLLVVNGPFNNENLQRNLRNLMETHYLRKPALDFLYWIKDLSDEQANQMNTFLLELLRSGLLNPSMEVLRYCPSCGNVSVSIVKNLEAFNEEACHNCKGVKLRQIIASTLNDDIKSSVWNGQILEIYAVAVLKKRGIKFIGGRANGYDCFTSIQYNTSYGKGEIDCICLIGDTLVFIETKMTTLTLTEFKKEDKTFEDVYERVSNGIPNLKKHKVFIAFRIDRNIETKNYFDCQFIDLFAEEDIAQSILNKVKSISQETIDYY